MSGNQTALRPVKAYLIGAWAAAVFLSLAALAFWGSSAHRAVEWRAVVAEVIAKEIRSPNSKDPPEIFATVHFELDGVTHEAEEGVFNSRSPSELEAALKDWPTGKRFDLFVDPDNPQSVAINPTGEAEGMVVAGVLFAMIGLLMLWIYRVGKKKYL